jgi:Bacterial Ig domain
MTSPSRCSSQIDRDVRCPQVTRAYATALRVKKKYRAGLIAYQKRRGSRSVSAELLVDDKLGGSLGDSTMWHGIIFSVTMLFLAAPASADSCLFSAAPPFRLSSDTVEWTMQIASGRTCTRGLKLGPTNVTAVKLIAPPQSGKVVIEGPSFSYAAKADFQGQDEFTVQVSGTAVRIAGVSEIKVTVSVVDK